MCFPAAGLLLGGSFKKRTMTFTEDQINAVAAWMNSWEQLEGTVIPIRFRESFSRFVEKGPNKPPLGVTPRFIITERRIGELMSAIARYETAGFSVPKEWREECSQLMNEV